MLTPEIWRLPEYDFIPESSKCFILTFDEAIREIGYDSNGLERGYCWGKHMIVYSKGGERGKKVAARIYIRENAIVLRLFLTNIDKHKNYIEAAPDFIQDPFLNAHGECHHCPDRKEPCKFRKTYSICNRVMEKCNGFTFEFQEPNMDRFPSYMALLKEFYPLRKRC